MHGLYIHIPFCQTRCAYCSFYSTTSHELVDRYVSALCGEIAQQEHLALSSVYLGGGTPSQLGADALQTILKRVGEHFHLHEDAEVTVEVNPDDVTPMLVETLRDSGVNRVSMGVQSFLDTELQRICRRHTAKQAVDAVRLLREGGISNISIDLIYGLPSQTLETFQKSIDEALSLPVEHISSYALSVEPGTLLYKQCEAGTFVEADDELLLSMYNLLRQRLRDSGFHHYEISNFARPGYEARHNSAYWSGAPYLGLGPGAHGYDGATTRYCNIPDLNAYLRTYESGTSFPPREIEHLSESELYDELLFTRLRTSKGMSLSEVPTDRKEYLLKQAAPHIQAGRLLMEGDALRLSAEALFVSDDIISDLMAAE